MQKETTKAEGLKALQVLHRAMLLGQILFAVIVFFFVYSGNISPALKGYDHILQVIGIALSFGGFFIGSSLFKKKMQQLKENSPDFKTKLATYRSATIIQWILLEGPSLFSLICFLLVGNYAFFALAVVFMLLFAVTAPNKTKMMLLLQLSEDEVSQL